jgi:hypothetical protein
VPAALTKESHTEHWSQSLGYHIGRARNEDTEEKKAIFSWKVIPEGCGRRTKKVGKDSPISMLIERLSSSSRHYCTIF